MTIIRQTPEPNGAYASQTSDSFIAPPDGWISVPAHLEAEARRFLPWVILSLENGEIVNITENRNKPEPVIPELTPAQLRKQAYETEPLIQWDGEIITVDAAGALWVHYAAEDSDKAGELSRLIIEAKTGIRDKYPD